MTTSQKIRKMTKEMGCMTVAHIDCRSIKNEKLSFRKSE